MNATTIRLCALLGISGLPEESLTQALTHISSINEQNLPLHDSNERLEFLGDAVLGLAVSQMLYKRYPQALEGELTSLRSQLVCREYLAMVAEKLHLGEMLIFGKGEQKAGGATKPALLADALEALFGVVFVAHGYDVAADVIERVLLSGEDLAVAPPRTAHHWKSQLQEIVQRQGPRKINYRTTRSGSAHLPTFAATLLVDGVIQGRGSGRSKQEAEQAAAREAVEKMAEAGKVD
jgi:ribonuclease-3